VNNKITTHTQKEIMAYPSFARRKVGRKRLRRRLGQRPRFLVKDGVRTIK